MRRGVWKSRYFAADARMQIDKLLKSSFADRQGNFNYREWVKVLRVNDDADEQPPQSLS